MLFKWILCLFVLTLCCIDVRVLFERIATEAKDKQIPEIWQRFLQYESLCSDLPSVLKLEKRRAAMFPDTGRDLKNLILRLLLLPSFFSKASAQLIFF